MLDGNHITQLIYSNNWIENTADFNLIQIIGGFINKWIQLFIKI